MPTDCRGRRLTYAEWLTAKDNPFFAKSTVNRVWSYFFGRGIIDPVDDIRASNPASNPALLDALTKDFLDHDFDLRQLMRTIANSRVYQSSIATNEWNQNDTDNFSHAMPRRIGAEALMDALALATGVRPAFPEAPPETRAEQVTDPHIGKDGFLDLFGRPSRESSCECERRSDLSLPQALEPGERPDHFGRRGRCQRARRQGHPQRQAGRGRGRANCTWRRSAGRPSPPNWRAA